MKTPHTMKTYKNLSNRAGILLARLAIQGCLASALVGLVGYGWNTAICQAQEENTGDQGAQVLTRGPVHEAFAGMATFNPEPGIIVAKEPPAAIEEIPPGERPVGDNITWIPGYWAWDEERGDFLWVSGTWRALPPGRQWMAGYWGKTTDGYQWTSGYWADAAGQETTYLPAPPKTIEDGPSTKAPSRDYGWTPGSWIWREQRYAWSPGYWQQGRADWDWMPAHYVWTPRGYIFVNGYWDYSVGRRGMLFAPVYFNAGLYSRPGYNYSPSIVLDLALFAEHLFLRPNYHHYYFGDYYAPIYGGHGYYAAYDYHSHRFGYDPIFSHQRWEHRADRGWDQRVATDYQYRRDHEDARPPRTWDALRKMDANTAGAKKNRMMLATPLDQMTKRKDGPVKFQKVAKEDRELLTQRDKEVRKSRDERRTLEAKGASTAALKPGEVAQPAKVQLPKSPIVGKSASELKKNQMPPAIPKSPKTLTTEPKAGTAGRPPMGNKNNPQLDPRRTDKTDLTPREPKGRDTIEPRRTDKTDLTPREPKVQPTPQPRRTEVTPREPKAQPPPQPRRTEMAPREPKAQPPAKSRSAPNDSEDKSGKKDHKKDPSRN